MGLLTVIVKPCINATNSHKYVFVTKVPQVRFSCMIKPGDEKNESSHPHKENPSVEKENKGKRRLT